MALYAFFIKAIQKARSFLEGNDVFALFFALVSLYLMYAGGNIVDPKFSIGLGIALYGLLYFVVHDWFVHQRLKSFKTKNKYLIKIRKAHKIHHKSHGEEKGKAFGLLYVKSKLI